MQKNATPTKAQRFAIRQANLNPDEWVVVKERSNRLLIANRTTSEFRTIQKVRL